MSHDNVVTKDVIFSYDGHPYRLTAVRRGGSYRLVCRDESEEVRPDFEVVCLGRRLSPKQGEDGIDLVTPSWLELASLQLLLDDRPVARLQVVPKMQRLTAAEREFAMERRHAWQSFYRMRTCPPLAELDRGSEEAQRHLRACPSCRELISSREKDAAWAELAKRMASSLPAPRKPAAQPGQVWSLLEELDGWDEDGLFIRSPQVLVLSVGNGIQAVPICPETKLIVEGDVFLGEEMGFAEAWNKVVIPAPSLSECWGSVDGSRLKQVTEQKPCSEAGVDWRYAFINLERHVADTLAKRALVYSLAMERDRTRDPVRRPWHTTVTDALRGLFQVPVAEGIALAADDVRSVPLTFLEADSGEMRHYRASITGWASDDEGIHVSGNMLLPKGMAPSMLLVWLDQREGDAVEAARSDIADSYFHVVLPALENATEADLRLFAVRY